MSGFAYLVISELAPTLQASAGVVNDLKKRHKKKKDEYNLYEKELGTSLGQGCYEIKKAFYEQQRQLEPYGLGEAFRTGDIVSNQHAQELILEARGIKSILELALQYKHEIDDVKGRWRSAERILQQTKQTMNDLNFRIRQANSPVAPAETVRSPQFDTRCAVYPATQNHLSMGSSPSSVDSMPTAGSLPYQSPVLQYSPSVTNYAEPQQAFPLASTNPKLSSSGQDKGPRISVLSRRRYSGTSSITSNTSDSHHSVGSFPLETSSQPTFRGTLASNPGFATISGRPEKKNGFHGFCEGAWTTQRDKKEGMRLLTLSNGLAQPYDFLQCHKCRFRAIPYGSDKKHASMDPRVRKSKYGIQYRFQFLAKSHKKCKDVRTWGEDLELRMDAQDYGCVICYAGGRPTDTFEGVDALMSHINLEHSGQMSAEVRQRTNCIWGRTADCREEFDINIPATIPPEHEIIAAPVELDITPLSIPELASCRSDGVFLGCNMSGPAELDGNTISRINLY